MINFLIAVIATTIFAAGVVLLYSKWFGITSYEIRTRDDEFVHLTLDDAKIIYDDLLENIQKSELSSKQSIAYYKLERQIKRLDQHKTTTV